MMQKLSTKKSILKVHSLLTWGELTAVTLFVFDFRNVVAPIKTMYCADILYL